MARVPAQRRGRGSELMPREEPRNPLDLFRRQFDTLFEHMWSSMLAPSGQSSGPTRTWDLDVSENDKEIVVRADVPGFEENELDVRLENNVLTIQAEKEQKGEGRQQYRSFYRAVTLPSGIDPDMVQANYRNGVLELHIPRPEGAQARRIQIQGQQAGGGPKTIEQKSGNGHQPQGQQGQQANQEEAPQAGST